MRGQNDIAQFFCTACDIRWWISGRKQRPFPLMRMRWSASYALMRCQGNADSAVSWWMMWWGLARWDWRKHLASICGATAPHSACTVRSVSWVEVSLHQTWRFFWMKWFVRSIANAKCVGAVHFLTCSIRWSSLQTLKSCRRNSRLTPASILAKTNGREVKDQVVNAPMNDWRCKQSTVGRSWILWLRNGVQIRSWDAVPELKKRNSDTCRSFAYEELRWIVLWEGNCERGHRGLMI